MNVDSDKKLGTSILLNDMSDYLTLGSVNFGGTLALYKQELV